jgi:hypothetical protein
MSATITLTLKVFEASSKQQYCHKITQIQTNLVYIPAMAVSPAVTALTVTASLLLLPLAAVLLLVLLLVPLVLRLAAVDSSLVLLSGPPLRF